MLPAQRNKVDLSQLNEQERMLFQKYGKMPNHKSILMKTQKERKYFDSGDYALSKAGVAPQTTVGTAIPSPENIPHSSPTPGQNNGASVSPTSSSNPIHTIHKEGSSLGNDQENNTGTEEKKIEDTEDEIEKDLQDEAIANEVSPVKLGTDESPMRTD